MLASIVFVAFRRYSTIGFIGLGNMGGPMAGHLARRNPVVGYDKNNHVREQLSNQLQIAANFNEFAKCQVIVTMLPASEQSWDVYCGKSGLLSTAKSGQLLIDCSTIDPQVSKEIAVACTTKGVDFVDAPVSGGTPSARAATLTFMAGGSNKAVHRAEEFLLQMGRRVFHVGTNGSGGAVKICNNLMASINLIGTSEVIGLGMRLGLKPKLLVDIMNQSSGSNWATESYCPVSDVMNGVPSSNNFENGFACDLMLKDLNLAQKLAQANDVPIIFGSVAQNLYRFLCDQDFGNKDSGIVSTLFTGSRKTSSGDKL